MSMKFQGFKPQALERIAGTMGFSGNMENFAGYLEEAPEAKQRMDMYNKKAIEMMNGGMVRNNYAVGGTIAKSTSPGGYAKIQDFDRDFTQGPANNPQSGPIAAMPRPQGGQGVMQGSPLISMIEGQDILEREYAQQQATEDYQIQQLANRGATQTSDSSTDESGSTDSNTNESGSTIPQLKKDTIDRMKNPKLAPGAVTKVVGTVATEDQDIATGTGKLDDNATKGTTTSTGPAETATAATSTDVNKVDPSLTGDKVDAELAKTTAATGEVSDDATIEAAETTKSSVSDLEAAEGESVDVEAVAKRVLDIKETINPVANAADAAKFTEEIEAATATPTTKATVKGQLAELMTDFEGGETPAWAAGALRAASAAMAARGLGASSMAGQALVQAAMEASLPIAMADAGTFAKFESQNLSNRQQRAMLAAEQRATFMGQEFDQKFQARVMNAAKVSDVANMNFNAEQQVALENSRAANTMALANLSNEQALLMGEVAALANLDMANLNNRQQAKVLNAKSFLDMDMANLNNKQQTEMFKAQTRTQSLFSDQAAENAAKQFNATSENQTDQFFANLKTQTSQFNANQTNAMTQFNAGEENSMSKFNAEIDNQRDQFNAKNSLVIAQSNANWRREIATAGTAAVNRANEINAANVLGISNQAHANLWQEHGDLMEWAWSSSEGERDRQNAITLSHLAAGKSRTQAESAADLAASNAMGDFVGKLLLGYAGSKLGF